MPNVKPILVKNYVFTGGVLVRQLDDFYAPCIITGGLFPSSSQATHVGFQPQAVSFALANSKQEATALANLSTGSLGIMFPLRLRRLVGVWVAVIGQQTAPPSVILSVIGDGETEDL